MNRRDFISSMAGVAAAWPCLTIAQTSSRPTIGYLDATSPAAAARFVAAFRDGLKASGYIEGQNLSIQYRWAEGEFSRLPAMAADLVKQNVTVIVSATLPATLAAKAAAKGGIPIVFALSADPVEFGVVSRLNNPDGNITGVTQVLGALGAKRVEILHEVAPSVRTIAILANPTNPHGEPHTASAKSAAGKLGLQSYVLFASTPAGIDAAMTSVGERGIGAVLVSDDPLFRISKDQLVALAAKQRVPTIYFGREFIEAGGLISYGPHFPTLYYKVGQYTASVLKGAKTAQLPVVQPDRFELVINRKTAKSLRLTIPPVVILRADEVIE